MSYDWVIRSADRARDTLLEHLVEPLFTPDLLGEITRDIPEFKSIRKMFLRWVHRKLTNGRFERPTYANLFRLFQNSSLACPYYNQPDLQTSAKAAYEFSIKNQKDTGKPGPTEFLAGDDEPERLFATHYSIGVCASNHPGATWSTAWMEQILFFYSVR